MFTKKNTQHVNEHINLDMKEVKSQTITQNSQVQQNIT